MQPLLLHPVELQKAGIDRRKEGITIYSLAGVLAPCTFEGREVNRVKKPISEDALLKETAFWESMTEAADKGPVVSCLK